MGEDARFEDASEGPLRLQAQDIEDLNILSALIQDAVFPASEMTWQPARRRFGLLINRFRWEDRDAGGNPAREAERVRALLVFDGVLKVASSGIDRHDTDTILSVLSIGFTPAEDGAGRIELTLAGDGAIALDVECIEATLRDVTRPYRANAGRAPHHDT